MHTQINKYRVQGKVYIWEYIKNNRNYPSWNLIADKEACDSLIALLRLMLSSPYSSHKKIQTCKLESSRDELMIIFNREKITELQAPFLKVKKGEGDFAITDDQDGNLLYFWWDLENGKAST